MYHGCSKLFNAILTKVRTSDFYCSNLFSFIFLIICNYVNYRYKRKYDLVMLFVLI